MSGKRKGVESPLDFNECVSKDELTKLLADQRTYIDGKFDDLICNINILVTRIEHVEQRPTPVSPRQPTPHDDGLEDDDDADFHNDARDMDRLRRNRHGMGGNNHHHANNDPFAKTKFTMIHFAGNADPEAYLDWELAVEQKFNSHLVPAEHRARLATSEFTGFALFWWNDLCNNNNATAVPQSWNVLKQRMKSHFVPPYYQRDLRMKLQNLKQGEKGVEEYYQELLIGLARCDIHEDDEDTCARFFGGLNRDIHDILHYKDWNRFNQLYHLTLKAEREVQGCCQQHTFRSNLGRSFLQQRSNVDKPKASVAQPPATPSATTHTSEVSNLSPVQSQPQKKAMAPGASSNSSNKIVCHRCKGIGYVMKDCPNRRASIATVDGTGYVSASDVEDELVLATNIVVDEAKNEEEVSIDSLAASVGYESLLVQRVLTSQLGHEEEKLQRHNLFHMFLIKDHRVLTIIDSGSCNNFVSSDLVAPAFVPPTMVQQ
nr:uncharacterized protein LOC117846013 [Setaria viridis]